MSEHESLEGLSPEEARRAKLERIAAMGLDPWGQRFDDRAAIQTVRDRIGEAKLKLESGEMIELPAIDDDTDFDFFHALKSKSRSMTIPILTSRRGRTSKAKARLWARRCASPVGS